MYISRCKTWRELGLPARISSSSSSSSSTLPLLLPVPHPLSSALAAFPTPVLWDVQVLHRGVTVRHANLPKYGAGWHSNSKA